MNRMLFGIAGVPKAARKGDVVAGLRELAKQGLEVMELEFVHGVRIKEDKAGEIFRTSAELGIALTAHGPYYINLNAKEQDKIDSSIERITQTARTASMCGATSITFHAAYYMKDDPRDVFEIVSKHLTSVEQILKNAHIDILIRPEITGKNSQFGTMEELVALSEAHTMIAPCIDFGQLHSRTGACNSYEDFMKILTGPLSASKKKGTANLHVHASGVEYNSKGEVKHTNLKDSPFDYEGLVRALVDADAGGAVVCESPSAEDDAILLKSLYSKYRASKS